MQFTRLAALVASISTTYAATRGFNYGSLNPSGSGKTLADFENEFNTAQKLTSGPGFTSARLYTMIQAGSANTPISAIQAAINTKTSLLLGLWASAGQDAFNNELAALDAAIKQYGSAFTDLVTGISVGSEDLYRITPTGILSNAGTGAGPNTLVTYIGEVRNVIKGTLLAGKPVGHVDTWTAYVNGSNSALISACDFLGVDAYPYFENTNANSIENGKARFFSAYDQTVAVSQGKNVWVTESGWPVSGPVSGQAVASVANSKAYYDSVGCELFARNIDTWWYTLYDGTPSPSFGIVGSTLSTTPLFDLTCPAAAASSIASTASVAASTQQQNQATGTTLATVVKPTTTVVAPATTAKATTAAAGTTSAGAVVSQISDGQVQAGTTKVVAPPAAGTTTKAVASQSTSSPAQPSGKSCPAALTGTWEYPHLIVPVDKTSPSTAAGTSYFGQFDSKISSIFNFDLPASYAGKTCSLVFLFPTQDQLTTSSYTFAGQGGLNVYELSSPATQSTSYSNVPAGVKIANIPDVKPGNSYTVASHECAAGQRVSFEFEATSSLALRYFQDYNPSPIGAYISVC